MAVRLTSQRSTLQLLCAQGVDRAFAQRLLPLRRPYVRVIFVICNELVLLMEAQQEINKNMVEICRWCKNVQVSACCLFSTSD